MLYALAASDIDRLRGLKFIPEFTGAEMLVAAFRTDPAVVARILPRPLRPPQEAVAIAFVARYPQTNFGCVYNEGALLVRAVLGREVGLYCLAMPVDDDMAMIGGRERLGFPKKMAEHIGLERNGDHVTGRVVRKGVEILRIEGELGPAAEATDLDVVGAATLDENGRSCRQVVSFLFKYSPSPGGRGFDYLPRLIRQATLFRPRANVRKAIARVVLASSPYDPLGEVAVAGPVLACFHGLWDNTMLPGRVVRRVWNVRRFLPHAFFKTDMVPVLLGWATDPRAKRETHGTLAVSRASVETYTGQAAEDAAAPDGRGVESSGRG